MQNQNTFNSSEIKKIILKQVMPKNIDDLKPFEKLGSYKVFKSDNLTIPCEMGEVTDCNFSSVYDECCNNIDKDDLKLDFSENYYNNFCKNDFKEKYDNENENSFMMKERSDKIYELKNINNFELDNRFSHEDYVQDTVSCFMNSDDIAKKIDFQIKNDEYNNFPINTSSKNDESDSISDYHGDSDESLNKHVNDAVRMSVDLSNIGNIMTTNNGYFLPYNSDSNGTNIHWNFTVDNYNLNKQKRSDSQPVNIESHQNKLSWDKMVFMTSNSLKNQENENIILDDNESYNPFSICDVDNNNCKSQIKEESFFSSSFCPNDQTFNDVDESQLKTEKKNSRTM
ncbi:hypothetical protein EDEG_01248 [Edhazardia aedis USNM 41457]|uniref:Uncharacterized protein n=1 Tax=Edhazardia aedis (strain USNM 41457) TaxID=1003232 RepID=J9DPU7_EDHAE|nr:hypothetical protein EDEG_01248 [Edhazardia aedis USNM 41457]|eukprot:EJW04565.1 hypothetical protein EDEG_01248 [Edhazardia aedis USNM 41457]